jgi:hypothetical protein
LKASASPLCDGGLSRPVKQKRALIEGGEHMSAADIAAALKRRRSSAGWICSCPAHDDHDPSLAVIDRDDKVLIKCRSGCPQDAVIDALKRLGLWGGHPHDHDLRSGWSVPKTGPASDPMKSWRSAAPFIRGTAVDCYLRFRGIRLRDEEARSLRFFSALWHWPTQSRWPAMVARVSLATGEDLTTHQTFIEPGGSRKAPLGDCLKAAKALNKGDAAAVVALLVKAAEIGLSGLGLR